MDVGYVVRLKSNALVGGRSASFLCERGRWKRWADDLHEVFGQRVDFASKRIRKGRDEYLAVISNRFRGPEAFEIYRQRWGIETLFGHLKKRGYQFEGTHLPSGCSGLFHRALIGVVRFEGEVIWLSLN